MLRCCAVLCGLVSVAALSTAETAPSPAATVEPLLHRFLARADEPLVEYRGSRHLEARNDRLNLDAWMDVATELGQAGFRYRVTREGGSDAIRGRVFRSLLDNEVEAFASGDAARSSFTATNYDLTLGEPSEPGLVKLLVRPRRRDVTLIDGAVYITDTDADLVRVEGRLAKSPSFWTRRVDIVKQYTRIGGLRVPVRVDSTAQIRFAGASTLAMTYQYDMINGITVVPSPQIAAR